MAAKVLIADDEQGLVELWAEFLIDEGYDVSVAFDGYEALRIFESTRPDLLVTDLRMPRMNGYELSRRVREISTVPIMAVSVTSLDVDKDDAFSAFLAKPFRLRELLLQIELLIAKRSGAPLPGHKSVAVAPGDSQANGASHVPTPSGADRMYPRPQSPLSIATARRSRMTGRSLHL